MTASVSPLSVRAGWIKHVLGRAVLWRLPAAEEIGAPRSDHREQDDNPAPAQQYPTIVDQVHVLLLTEFQNRAYCSAS